MEKREKTQIPGTTWVTKEMEGPVRKARRKVREPGMRIKPFKGRPGCWPGQTRGRVSVKDARSFQTAWTGVRPLPWSLARSREDWRATRIRKSGLRTPAARNAVELGSSIRSGERGRDVNPVFGGEWENLNFFFTGVIRDLTTFIQDVVETPPHANVERGKLGDAMVVRAAFA